MSDKIRVTVLPDGTIKTVTDKISMPNHTNAANFLKRLQSLCGGVTKFFNKQGHAVHSHGEEEHEHEHGGHHHH